MSKEKPFDYCHQCSSTGIHYNSGYCYCRFGMERKRADAKKKAEEESK